MRYTTLLFLAIVSATLASAATVIVTSPVGVYTNSGSSNSGDVAAEDTWLRTNVRNNGSVGITNDYANAGNGSVWFEGTQGPSGSSSKADFEYLFGADDAFTLSSLSSLSYDWYRSSSSTANANLHPVIRLYIDADGNLATTNDQGYLIFELAYNGVSGAVATDSWQTSTITGSTYLWLVQFGLGSDYVYSRTLSDYQAGSAGYTPTTGYAQISGSSLIYGISVGIGSGWGAFEGAVDNITYTTVDGASTTFNFETAGGAVPEPGTYAMLAGGLAVLALWRRRR